MRLAVASSARLGLALTALLVVACTAEPVYERIELPWILDGPEPAATTRRVELVVEVGCLFPDGSANPADLDQDVTYGSETIKITISALKQVDSLCYLASSLQPLTVELNEALGDRTIVEAADFPYP